MWANKAQEQISDMLNSSLLYAYDKKNLRSLSKEEFDEVENIKFNVLCYFNPFEDITVEKVHEALLYSKSNETIKGMVKAFVAQFVSNYNRRPKIEELRQIYSSSYALQYE